MREYIDSESIVSNSPYDELISMLEDAFVAYELGKCEMPDKSYVRVDKHNGDFRSMPAYIDTEEWEASGVKWVNVHPDNTDLETVMGTVIYTDPSNGAPVAVLDGTEITKRRTAAVSALATDYLAPSGIKKVGVLGAGVQSYEQIYALQEVREFNTILVSDVDDTAIEDFKTEFSEYTVESTTPNELTKSDVLYTMTPVTEPLIDTIHNDSIHINAMGADAPKKQEFTSSVCVDPTMNIIVDSYSQAMHSGEISIAIHDGDLNKENITSNLSSVLTGDSVVSTANKTLFDSTGLAIQDIATAHLVYTKNKQNL